jgi:SdrD B-like protein
MQAFTSNRTGNETQRAAIRSLSYRFQPSVLTLEDRTVPSTVSSLSANFNSTPIPAGDDIWFSSVAKVQGVGSNPANIWVGNQTISFSADGTNYTVNVPNTTLTVTPGSNSATATYDATSNAWSVAVPTKSGGLLGGLLGGSTGGNAFLGGAEFQAVNGLPGGIQNVTWQATFTSDTPGVSVNWQWTAAAYSNLSSNLSALGVKAMDGSGLLGLIGNSDKAGTPESYKQYVTGGAMGNGGSNPTGSYSSAASLSPQVGTNPFVNNASISGYYFADENGTGTMGPGDSGVPGITITLTGTDINGNQVTLTTQTDANGYYSFTGLAAGTYSISAAHSQYQYGPSDVGTVNGNTDGTAGYGCITGITLGANDQGVNYNFAGEMAD